MDEERNLDADIGLRCWRTPRWVRVVLGLVLAAALAGCTEQGGQHASSRWRPESIENLALAAGQRKMAAGHGYDSIAMRSQDPRPLSVGQVSGLPLQGGSPKDVNVSSDCGAMVTSQAVRTALAVGGCSQVLRMADSVSSSDGNTVRLVYIFNLASGSAVYKAARAFGEEYSMPNGGATQLGFPRNFTPVGFVRSWPKTPAADMAGMNGNFAYVDGFGHFLFVVWSGGAPSTVNAAADGLADTGFGQFAENRINCDTAPRSMKRYWCAD